MTETQGDVGVGLEIVQTATGFFARRAVQGIKGPDVVQAFAREIEPILSEHGPEVCLAGLKEYEKNVHQPLMRLVTYIADAMTYRKS